MNDDNLKLIKPIEIFKANKELFCRILAFIVGLWVLSGFFIYFSLSEWTDRGTFGDMFGMINALFSGLALFGIIVAIFLQTQELDLQRRELKQSTIELSRSAEAQEKTSNSLSKQADLLFITAKLNSLNSLIETCDRRFKSEPNAQRRLGIQKQQEKYMRELEEIMVNLEKTFENQSI